MEGALVLKIIILLHCHLPFSAKTPNYYIALPLIQLKNTKLLHCPSLPFHSWRWLPPITSSSPSSPPPSQSLRAMSSSSFPSSAFLSADAGFLSPGCSPPISDAAPFSCYNPLYGGGGGSCSASMEHEVVSLDPLSPSARIRSCDVYIGFSSSSSSFSFSGGRDQKLLIRFVKWLRAELEMQGVVCFASDRRRCRDARAHGVARAAMDAATFGMVVVTAMSLENPYTVEELRWFLERKKLVPVFFRISQVDCNPRDIIAQKGELWERYGGELWTAYGGVERDWRDAVNGLSRSRSKLEVNSDNFRDMILDALVIAGTRLGRRSIEEKVWQWRKQGVEELPFPRNASFVGRRRELLELEMLLFGDAEAKECIAISTDSQKRNSSEVAVDLAKTKQGDKMRSKGKEAVIWKESDSEIELQGDLHNKWPSKDVRKNNATKVWYGRGIACISGDSGIGKTELLLEFAYKFKQSYKTVLWVGGESRYLRQNYMKMMPYLGVDIPVENEDCQQRKGSRSFKEIEAEAISKVRKELMRDIPFLLIINNLECENDWWDGRSIIELLPRFGGGTHIVISTCLPQVLSIQPLRLSYLSGAEALSLMTGGSNDMRSEDVDALRLIEEKLGRLPLGLALVGAILSELKMDPSKLLDSVNRIPYKEFTGNAKENLAFRHNPFLVQLLGMCFSVLDHAEWWKKLATRMVEASSWFAPTLIPISLLIIAANNISEKHKKTKLWKRYLGLASCTCLTPDVNISEDEISSILVRFLRARNGTRAGYISFHNLIKIYACKRSGVKVASSVVRAINIEGSTLLHADHIWAACFLIFKFGSDPPLVKISTHDMLSFIRKFVLPLAASAFGKFSECNATLELLRVSSEALEAAEEPFLSEATTDQHTFTCSMSLKTQSSISSEPLLYRDLASVRATLLQARANFMLLGGQYDIGEQLCRTAVNINEVIYGWEHPNTQSSRKIMEQFITLQSKY